MTKMMRPRRLAVAVVAVSALTLSACGGNGGDNGGDNGGPAAGGVSNELEEVYDINPMEVGDLQEGGQLTLPVGHVGPQFNTLTNDGNALETNTLLGPIDNVGAWKLDPLGDYILNEDYFVSAEQEITEDGTQILRFELNPDAVWNDGTPIDFDTYAHTAEIRSGDNEEYDLVSTSMYDQVESVEQGDSEWEVIVTMDTPYQPWESMFSGGIIHPDIDTPELFNESFVQDIRPEYRAGPYTLDVHDRAANVVSLVPNENWWGDTPVLERINFAQHESSASIQSFQNGQIDAVSVATADRYAELEEWATPEEGDYEIRRGQRMATCGFIINTEAEGLDDVDVREALFRTLNREELASIQFEEIGWEEEPPGSWLLLPFDDRYEDAYPVDDSDPEGAREGLIEAGWEDNGGDYLERDGEELTIRFDTFGDDPTNQAMALTAQNQASQAGINLEINNRGSGEFGEAVGSRDFGFVNLCYNKSSADPTAAVNQFYGTGPGNLTGASEEEYDERITELREIEDQDERIALANELEQEAIAAHFHYLGYSNGPVISAYREGLANYGPRLFETVDWTIVGWADDADHDGTDTGVDVDDLDEDSEPEEEADDE